MHYLRTKTGTDFEEKEPFGVKVLRKIFFFVTEANPGYRNKMHLVKEWLIEFDENDMPYREIGLNRNGEPVLAGPDDKNYGFWLDTEMKFNNFEGEEISKVEFVKLWETYFDSEGNKSHAF